MVCLGHPFLNFLYKFDDRIKKKYGHCSNESIGYLLYLKKEYEINDNPKIINYVHVPNGKWAIINTKIINEINNIELLCKKNPLLAKSIFFNFCNNLCKKANKYS